MERIDRLRRRYSEDYWLVGYTLLRFFFTLIYLHLLNLWVSADKDHTHNQSQNAELSSFFDWAILALCILPIFDFVKCRMFERRSFLSGLMTCISMLIFQFAVFVIDSYVNVKNYTSFFMSMTAMIRIQQIAESQRFHSIPRLTFS